MGIHDTAQVSQLLLAGIVVTKERMLICVALTKYKTEGALWVERDWN